MIIAIIFLIALAVVTARGMVAIRRHNIERNRNRRERPVTAMRYRHLNVVNPCDNSPSCMAKSHNPLCVRGRSVPREEQ